MKKGLEISAKILQSRYRLTLLSSAGLIILAIITLAWISIHSQHSIIQNKIKAQGKQLQFSLEQKLEIAGSHVFTMKRIIETKLSRPKLSNVNISNKIKSFSKISPKDAPWENLPPDLKSEFGALHIDTTLPLDPKNFQRDLNAVINMLPHVVSTHKWHKVFQWSYHYNAEEKYWVIYPFQSRKTLFEATKTNDMRSALQTIFNADGTFPIKMMNPQNNPMHKMIWTPPYEDASGKGRMVTLLAPVYLENQYIGVVATDVTLQIMETVIMNYPLDFGRSIIIDNEGTILADSGGSLKNSKGNIKILDIIKQKSLKDLTDSSWIQFPLHTTNWKLIIYAPEDKINFNLLLNLYPYFLFSFFLIFTIITLSWLQNRFYALPALQLAEFVDSIEKDLSTPIPSVPFFWYHRFERVYTTVRERKELFQATIRQANELEQKVKERTLHLDSALKTVQALNEKQDGDYYLNTVLIDPLIQNNAKSNNIEIEFFIKQKKNFTYRNTEYELGGDINISDNIILQNKNYIVFLNGDAMGKSIQGAGGVLVLGTIFKSIIQRTFHSEYNTKINPEAWLKNAFLEMNKAFESFDGYMFMSLVFGLIDEKTGKMFFINADHPKAVIYRDGNTNFIGSRNQNRKLGSHDEKDGISVENFLLKSNDIIIMGSDGRDDIILHKDNDEKMINHDEFLFLNHVKKAKGDLKIIYNEILKSGMLYDDLSLLKIKYNKV